MKLERTIMLVDMDAFFASIEVAQRPWLMGRPLIVIGGAAERSVVNAATYEAKAFGIRGGMPAYIAREICPQGVFVQADLDKYVYVSGLLVKLFEDYSSLVEPSSIDECYIDLTGSLRLFGTPKNIALEIKSRVREELDLTASVGIAPNKSWAKIACGMGKPDGLTVIKHDIINNISRQLPIRSLPGVGAQTEQILNRIGLQTIHDIAEYPSESLERLFGVCGPQLQMIARGIDESPVVPWKKLPKPKSVGHEYTFPEDVVDVMELKGILAWLTETVVRRMRMMKAVARTVQLKLRYSDYRTLLRRKTAGKVSSEKEAYHYLERLFEQNIMPNRAVRQIGVTFSGLTYSESQLPEIDGLFPEQDHRHAREAVDAIQSRYGEDSIHWGRTAKWLN